MAYQFDDKKKKVELTTDNQRNLYHVEQRIRGTQMSVEDGRVAFQGNITQEQADREIVRLNMARDDIMKKMKKKEIKEYNDIINAVKSKSEIDAERKAAAKEMDKNKDKPSH